VSYVVNRRSVPADDREGRMSFTFTLEHEDGSPAEPSTFKTVIPNWNPGDTIPLGRDRTLRVIATRADGDDAVLVVEDA
jgi:hypothetical protein